MTRKHVIIGNSAAAVGAVEAIRENDIDGQILMISEEPYSIYSRPLISYFLGGAINLDKIYYRPKNFYDENNVETLFGKKAVGISVNNKEVNLESGENILYDQLLIATGGKPFVPPIKGRQAKGVFTFTNLDDAKKIKDYLPQVKRAVVIGGGLIGIKATEGLLAQGVKVNIVELAENILGTIFDDRASQIIEDRLMKEGVLVIKGNSVEEIKTGQDRVRSVYLRDGKEIDCQLVILAIGVVPRVEIIDGTGISIEKGVLVDEHMETNIKGIYAAGDVAQANSMIGGEKQVVPIWPNAYIQGKIAGSNMSGNNKSYIGSLVMNSIEIIDIPTISAGLTQENSSKHQTMVFHDDERKVYRKIVVDGKNLVGYIFINSVDRAGIYTGLIKDKIDISNFKERLISEDFGLIDWPREKRQEKILRPKGGWDDNQC